MNYFIEYTNQNFIFTRFILAGRIKITLVRALWGGCCPLTLGVSHKQLLHSGTPKHCRELLLCAATASFVPQGPRVHGSLDSSTLFSCFIMLKI